MTNAEQGRDIRALLSALTCLLIISACSSECENEIKERILSPDGKIAAVVFSRGCGATTGHNIHISLTSSVSSNAPGNVFIADRLPDGFTHEAASIRWLSSSKLQISYIDEIRVFKSETRKSDISIHYAKKPAGTNLRQ